MQNVNLTNMERVCRRSLKKDCAYSPPFLLSAATLLLSDWSTGQQLTSRLAVERGLHVEWTVRFSFSISICEDTVTQHSVNLQSAEQTSSCCEVPAEIRGTTMKPRAGRRLGNNVQKEHTHTLTLTHSKPEGRSV